MLSHQGSALGSGYVFSYADEKVYVSIVHVFSILDDIAFTIRFVQMEVKKPDFSRIELFVCTSS